MIIFAFIMDGEYNMKQSKFQDTSRYRTTLFLSLMIVFAAQININLFIDNFKISIAVICFPVFLFLMENVALIPVTLLSAAGVYLSRILLFWFQTGEIAKAYKNYFPEMIFYLIYGCLLFLYQFILAASKNPVLSKNKALLPFMAMDYLSNLAELILRLGAKAFSPKTQLSILLIALMRTMLIWMVLTIFDRYRLTLLSRAHAERYQRLMVLISKLNSEVIWMQKNASLIEDTMNTSYQLYHNLEKVQTDPALSSRALTVAKDIHEIKKEYLLIMRGLSEALQTELTEDGMTVDDLLELLQKALSLEAHTKGKELLFRSRLHTSLRTDSHYALMSVFHNLFTNAMEASESGKIELDIEQAETEKEYIFSVSDNGPGISEEFQNEIFEPGFSTKINYSTGAVSRGLGLNIVKDIIENQFGGHIGLSSIPGRTTFTIYIPKTSLEVISQ